MGPGLTFWNRAFRGLIFHEKIFVIVTRGFDGLSARAKSPAEF